MALRALALAGGLVMIANAASAQQAPPPAIVYPSHVSVGGSPPSGAVMTNPLPADSATLAEGQKLFDGFNCSGCHPGAGPALTDGRWKYGGSDGAIYTTIFYGRARGMPAFGGAIPSEAIWKLVAFLKNQKPDQDSLATSTWAH